MIKQRDILFCSPRKRMLAEILTEKKERKKKIDLSLNEMITQLKNIGAIKIIAFGSYVSGSINKWSDLDILVIMPNIKNSKEWAKIIYEKIELKVATDIIIYNYKEFEENLPYSRFLRNILKTGKIVYERV